MSYVIRDKNTGYFVGTGDKNVELLFDLFSNKYAEDQITKFSSRKDAEIVRILCSKIGLASYTTDLVVEKYI